MPRLIGAEDLGTQLPRTSPSVTSWRAGIAETAAADAFRQVGQAGQDLQNAGLMGLRLERQKKDAADQTAYVTAGSNLTKTLLEHRNALEQDQDYATYKDRWFEAANKARDEQAAIIQDPSLKQRFMASANLDIAQGWSDLAKVGHAKEADARIAQTDALIAQNLETAVKLRDPAQREKLVAGTGAAIDALAQGGWITQEAAGRAKRKFAVDYATGYYDTLPPAQRLAALTGQPAAQPSAPGAIQSAPLLPQDVATAIDRNASSDADAALLKQIAAVESGGNPGAVNPQSGAAGLFQFTPGTAAQYGLANPTDANAAAAAAQRLLDDNRTALTAALGRPPTDGELYLAHQQGATGAAALLANPDKPAVTVLTSVYGSAEKAKAAIKGNGGTEDMTAGDFANLWTSKFGGAPISAPMAEPAGGYDLSKPTGTPVDLIPTADRLKMIGQAQDELRQADNDARQRLQASVAVGYDDWRRNAFLTGTADPTAKAQIMAAHPDERGLAMVNELDRQAARGVLNQRINSQSAAEDTAMLADYQKAAAQSGPGSAQAAQALKDATDLVAAKQDALKKDPAAWAQANSPAVADAASQWQDATDPKEQAIAFNVYAAQTIAAQQAQGVADPKILPADAAARLGEQLNPKPGQSAEEAVANIDAMTTTFGQYAPQVFGEIGGKLSDAARTVAWMDPNQHMARARLIEANQNKATIEDATKGSVGTDIQDKVAGQFAGFMATFAHDPAALAEGLKVQNQAELLARLYVSTGMDAGAAAEKVRAEMIDPKYDVSLGVRVPVAFDAEKVKNGAERAIADLGAAGLDPVIDDLGAGDGTQKAYLRSLQTYHSWVNSPDGQGLVLVDQNDRPVLKGGKPYQINFDRLQSLGQQGPLTGPLGNLPAAPVGGSYAMPTDPTKPGPFDAKKPANLSPDVQAVVSKFPALAKVAGNVVVEDKQAAPGDPRQLESFPPWESYNPNPGKFTTQVFNQSAKGEERTNLIAGDMLHYLGAVDPTTGKPVDPKYRALKEQLLQSMTPAQTADSRRSYDRAVQKGDFNGTFEDFMDLSRGDEFIMGYVSPDKADEWRKQGIYTAEQKKILEKMKAYLETGGQPQKKTDNSAKYVESAWGGIPTNITGDAGTYGRMQKADAQQAIAAGIFYGTGYEGAKAVNDSVTKEDFAGLQKYAHKSAIVSLGLDPSVMNIGGSPGEGNAGDYVEYRGILGQLWPTDEINLKAQDGGGFNSRVAAHESAHRGLSQLVDAVYGRDGLFGQIKAPWADTSKFTKAEKAAVAKLRDIVDDSDNNHTYNEYLTRIIEEKITGDPMTLYPIRKGFEADDPNGVYGKIDDAEIKKLSALVGEIEGAAAKVVAQRRKSGPR